ncbi:MAG: diphthine--ammonia ligase [Candidatus Aenigmarchaeota archaeon]|nr:diphthine--ammonia ligase [Candidatus Aenigmarchaeota archaeon]
MKLLSLISSGKDSWYAYYLMLQQGFDIPVAVTFIPKNPESYMLQHPFAEKTPLQIKNMKSPPRHVLFNVSGVKEKEVEEMKSHLEKLVKAEKIEGIISGALASEYQKQRLDLICEELGVVSYAPLWHKDQERYLQEVVLEAGFEFLIADTCAEGIEKWKGRMINPENLGHFIKDLRKARANISGEGGEYETFVTKSPFFEMSKV